MPEDFPSIDVFELELWRRNQRDCLLLDVREPWETALCLIEGSLTIPMGQIPDHTLELPQDCPIVVICHHGMRSAHITLWLRRHGFDQVVNLTGGVDAWAREIDPALALY